MKIKSKSYSLLFAFVLIACSAQAQYKQTMANKTQLLSNKDKTIPFGRLDELKIAVAIPSTVKYRAFIEQLERYAEVKVLDLNQLNEQGKLSNTIIVAGTASDLASGIQQ
jgi:hypothetical protein